MPIISKFPIVRQGGGGADVSVVTAEAGDVLAGKVIVDVNGEPITGTMTNRGAVSQTLNAGGSYTIPAGYHDGNGKVTANSLASQTDGDATAADILSGKTAYVDGAKVTGSMTNNGAVTPSALNAGGSYTIPAGYHNGSGKVTVNSLASQTDGDATAANILSGKIAWVDGAKVTGSMTNQGAKTSSLNAGGSYTIPAGYHNGSGKITANSLASQTSATATAADIISGKTAWVNGSKITGTKPNVSAASGSATFRVDTSVNQLYLDGVNTYYGSMSCTLSMGFKPVTLLVKFKTSSIRYYYFDYMNSYVTSNVYTLPTDSYRAYLSGDNGVNNNGSPPYIGVSFTSTGVSLTFYVGKNQFGTLSNATVAFDWMAM